MARRRWRAWETDGEEAASRAETDGEEGRGGDGGGTRRAAAMGGGQIGGGARGIYLSGARGNAEARTAEEAAMARVRAEAQRRRRFASACAWWGKWPPMETRRGGARGYIPETFSRGW